MLEHVEFEGSHHAFQFAFHMSLYRGHTYVCGAAYEVARLPCGRYVGNEPLSDFRIVDIECPGFGVSTGLRPIHPNAKFEPMAMSIFRNRSESAGKLLCIGIPVTDSAKPARVYADHLDSQLR